MSDLEKIFDIHNESYRMGQKEESTRLKRKAAVALHNTPPSEYHIARRIILSIFNEEIKDD